MLQLDVIEKLITVIERLITFFLQAQSLKKMLLIHKVVSNHESQDDSTLEHLQGQSVYYEVARTILHYVYSFILYICIISNFLFRLESSEVESPRIYCVFIYTQLQTVLVQILQLYTVQLMHYYIMFVQTICCCI